MKQKIDYVFHADCISKYSALAGIILILFAIFGGLTPFFNAFQLIGVFLIGLSLFIIGIILYYLGF